MSGLIIVAVCSSRSSHDINIKAYDLVLYISLLRRIWINGNKVELHLSGRWLSGSPIIRTCLDLRVNLSGILENKLDLKLPVVESCTVDRVMASTASNQTWSKSLDVDTC